MTTLCQVDGCDKTACKKGMCDRNYRQARRAETLTPCKIDDCQTNAYRKGLCPKHYKASRTDLAPCSVEGCDSKVIARGYCTNHYHRFMKYGDPLAGQAPPNAGLDLIKATVANPPDECVFWPYGKTEAGYGTLIYQGHRITVPRLTLTLYEGLDEPPGPGIVTRHKCGNGLQGCFGPKCLEWGTPADNIQDTVDMDRVPKGEDHCHAKLTEKAVQHIRESELHNETLAAMHGVSRFTIHAVKTRKNWAWLDD